MCGHTCGDGPTSGGDGGRNVSWELSTIISGSKSKMAGVVGAAGAVEDSSPSSEEWTLRGFGAMRVLENLGCGNILIAQNWMIILCTFPRDPRFLGGIMCGVNGRKEGK